MKSLFVHYFASLREREELDVVIPNMLSELGLHVFSRPSRGTRQQGVDVGAFGKLGDDEEKVYLVSIKSGDLTRATWNGNDQALRPSLAEIVDSYIPHRLPSEYRGKKIAICICVGGEVREQVRANVRGFIDGNIHPNIEFQEWNGERLAGLLGESLFRDAVLPEGVRPLLRKSLALIDEPTASYSHFKKLSYLVCATAGDKEESVARALKQLAVSVWMLFAWCREENNLESAYLSSECAMLYGWHAARPILDDVKGGGADVAVAIDELMWVHLAAAHSYFEKVLPYTKIRDAIGSAVRSASHIDVNLKLFDLLGRLSTYYLWLHHVMSRYEGLDTEFTRLLGDRMGECLDGIAGLITNNACLYSPLKDDQAIDVFLACLALASGGRGHDVIAWLEIMTDICGHSLRVKDGYPCIYSDYRRLLGHPERTEEYFKNATASSVLYPTIAFWAAQLGSEALFDEVKALKDELLPHCSMQYWFPLSDTEEHLYLGSDSHGGTFTEWSFGSISLFLDCVRKECEATPSYARLSAVKYRMLPLVCSACRHHRYPIPLHMVGKGEPNNDLHEGVVGRSERDQPQSA